MRKPTLQEVILLAVGLAIGWTTGGGVQAQTPHFYRVLGTVKSGTMEKELNEAARQGCEPLIGIGASEYSDAMLVLRCP
jgi:hypothetical protein